MSEWHEWSKLLRELCRLAVHAASGTLILLATADNPWDGDELFKGPAVGLGAYSGDRGFKRFLEPRDD